jgi:hypothetical protein
MCLQNSNIENPLVQVGAYLFFGKPPSVPLETVSQCHCEGVKQPKQSHKGLKTKRLPRSLRLLATTNTNYDTVSFAKRGSFFLAVC